MTASIIKSVFVSPEKARQVFDLLDVSETTRKDYKLRIGLFVDFITGRELNINTFREYKVYLQQRIDYGISTKNKYLATARIFLKELNRNGILPQDITQNIKSFAQEKKHKKDGLNDLEVSRVVERMNSLGDDYEGSRVKAIIALLIFQGLRQIEIVRLNVEDLRLSADKPVIFVQGKGRDDKEPVFLQPITVEKLRDYLRLNRVRSGALFVSRSNNSRNERLSTKTIRVMVKDLLRGLDIEKSTHGFRHYFTTKLIKSYKGDLTMVQGYTRHRSLEMLQVYNDNINREADLPRFFQTFSNISF